MPPLREHLKAARMLLGYSDPLVHRLLDRAVERLGPRHRFVYHNQEYIKFIGQMLGRDAALEATLHLLQDWGLVEPSDYRFKAPGCTGKLSRKAVRGEEGMKTVEVRDR